MRKKAAYLFTESYIFYFSISTISQKATHALKIQKKMKKALKETQTQRARWL